MFPGCRHGSGSPVPGGGIDHFRDGVVGKPPEVGLRASGGHRVAVPVIEAYLPEGSLRAGAPCAGPPFGIVEKDIVDCEQVLLFAGVGQCESRGARGREDGAVATEPPDVRIVKASLSDVQIALLVGGDAVWAVHAVDVGAVVAGVPVVPPHEDFRERDGGRVNLELQHAGSGGLVEIDILLAGAGVLRRGIRREEKGETKGRFQYSLEKHCPKTLMTGRFAPGVEPVKEMDASCWIDSHGMVVLNKAFKKKWQ